MTRTQVYHGESCEGAVVANFFVEGGEVTAFLCDGDVSNNSIRYRVEEVDGVFTITETDDLSTQSSGYFAGNPKVESHKTEATTREEALALLIAHIVDPYKQKHEFSMPVDAQELREGLERELL